MTRALFLMFGVVAYFVFFATFLYLVAFVGDLPWVPRTVDRGDTTGSIFLAALINLGLVALFGLQHSVMARPAFKRAWTKIVPEPLERSIYVLCASIMLILLFLFWQPIPAPVRVVTHGIAATAIWVLFALGWLIVLSSTFLINHFELFGLTQVWGHARGKPSVEPSFRTPLFYCLASAAAMLCSPFRPATLGNQAQS